MKISEQKDLFQLATRTTFDPYQIQLTLTDLTTAEQGWLRPLLADLDVLYQQLGTNFAIKFDIYQFEAFKHAFLTHESATALRTQIQQIWSEHQVWWRGRNFSLNLTTEPIVYSIINTSPDSFYDGGVLKDMDAVMQRVAADVEAGAKVIEVGGQTTRPGFKPITPEVEIKRTVPQVKAIKQAYPDVVVAVDTYKAPVMRAVLAAGADVINDVNGFNDDPEKLRLLREYQPAVLTMHENRGRPYKDSLTPNIRQFFKTNMEMLLQEADLDYEAIALDQGIGYSANADNIQDFAFMRSLSELNIFGRPTMVAVSNKGFYGKLLGLAKDNRLLPTIVSETVMIQQGGRLIRVHDVKATADMIKLLKAINTSFLIDKENDEIKS
ncbi:dihydropteroate synthase [Agrilactobacillus fermenti]|uniref:dihydropteroate synthase n=1 Tax=Agrilactobacillus fermenti TaxID=2586909 RepID=UPI003A5C40B3